jgi:hypothetical protein
VLSRPEISALGRPSATGQGEGMKYTVEHTAKYACGILAASLLTTPLALTTPATASASAADPIRKSRSRWVQVPGVPIEAKTCAEQKTDASGSQSRISTGARYHYDGEHPVRSIFTEMRGATWW